VPGLACRSRKEESEIAPSINFITLGRTFNQLLYSTRGESEKVPLNYLFTLGQEDCETVRQNLYSMKDESETVFLFIFFARGRRSVRFSLY
jgi:hypothetical protein